MAKTKISEFSTTPGDNTDINGINIAEGCAPSGINNAIRELMSDLKEWQSGAMDVYVIPQGTAAAPGIQFYSDTNTGLYRYAADQLGIAVGGVSAGYFSSDGWVGNVVATTIDLTNIEVTNIKAKDGTAAISIADSTGKVTVSSELAVDNLNLSGNTFSSTDTNGNIVLAPNGTGDVYLDADTIRVGDANSNVTVTTNGTGDLILNTNSGTNSGAITIEDGVNGNILIATNGTGQVQLTGDLDVTTVEVTNIKAKDGTSVFTLTDSTGAVSIANAVTMAATTQNIALGTSQTSGTFTVGGAAQTGTQTFDQSTKTHTLNIGTGATESAATKTINIGTGGVATSTTAIAVGSTNGTTITLNGTVNATTVNATTLDLTNLEVTNIKAKDGTAALSIADSTGNVTVSSLLNVDNLRLDGNTLSSTNTNGAINLTPNGTGQVTVTNDALINSLTVGRGAGAVSTNTAVGASALAANTTGAYNTAVGANALKVATDGGEHTVIGFNAGAAISSSFSNTAIGYNALPATTTGNANTAVGSVALLSNTTGANNTAVGVNALRLNTTASNNTAVGYQSLYSNQTGTSNVAIGHTALYSNTASSNTAVGIESLYGNTSGTENSALGQNSLTANTTGSYNVAIGKQALRNNTTASNNTAVGYQAGYSFNYTSGVGYSTFLGERSGYNVTTGINNTFVGSTAGYSVTTGSKNTIIGSYTGNNGGLDIRTANNYIVLSDGDGNPRQIIDGSGNLGLGVTPSAWAVGKAIEINPGGNAVWGVGTNSVQLVSNYYYDGSYRYKANGYANRYDIGSSTGIHAWFTAPSGTAGNTITFTQAMTLDASGNLLVGETSASAYTPASSGKEVFISGDYLTSWANNRFIGMPFSDGANYKLGIELDADSRCVNIICKSPDAGGGDRAIKFFTGQTPTERARITSGGLVQVSSGGSVQIGGTAARATTAGTNRLDIFNGTAPVGTLSNGISIYSSSGEAYVMDAAGNATLFSPHDAETNEWIFKSKHTPTGKTLKIDVEKLLRFINDHFGLDAVHEFIEE